MPSAQCAAWAAAWPSECIINPDFMHDACASHCKARGKLSFESANICQVLGAGMTDANGYYVRAPGMLAHQMDMGHVFGRFPYVLYFQEPEPASAAAAAWTGFLLAPTLGGDKHLYWTRQPGSEAAWWVANGEPTAPRVACFPKGTEPAAARDKSSLIYQHISSAESALGIAVSRHRRQAPKHVQQPGFLYPRALDALESSFLAALNLDPTHGPARMHAAWWFVTAVDSNMLGWYYFGDVESCASAARRLDRAIELLPDSPSVWAKAAETQRWLHDPRAVASYQRAASLLASSRQDPTTVTAATAKILVASRQTKAPNPSEMQVALGRALAWSSRHDEAVDALEAAVRLNPTEGVAYGLLAEQLIATLGERTQTRRRVRQATPPAHHEGLANLESRLESALAATARLAPARLPYLPAWLPKELGRAAGFEFGRFGGAAGAVPAQPEDMASAWHSFSRSRMELPAMRKRLQRRADRWFVDGGKHAGLASAAVSVSGSGVMEAAEVASAYEQEPEDADEQHAEDSTPPADAETAEGRLLQCIEDAECSAHERRLFVAAALLLENRPLELIQRSKAKKGDEGDEATLPPMTSTTDDENNDGRFDGNYPSYDESRLLWSEGLQARARAQAEEAAAASSKPLEVDATPCVILWRSAAGTLAHFGHAQIDGLWPFLSSYLQGRFDGCTSLHTLDIGVFMVPLLRSAVPHIPVVPFHAASQVPRAARPVAVHGHGMPKPTDLPVFHSSALRAVRLFSWLQCAREARAIDAHVQTSAEIILIGRRNASAPLRRGQSSWEGKCQLDNQRETAAMARFHSTGTNQGLRYTCGAAATGATKRNITNEDEVAGALRSTFGERFAVVAPEALSPCGQVAAFSRARLVIGQHGAALSNAIFMREGAAMLELQPVPHAVFEQVCAAVGIRYLALAESGFSHVYAGKDRRQATLVPLALAEVARGMWDAL